VLFAARAGMAWERFAGVWAPPLLALGLIAALAVWGGFEVLSQPMRRAVFAAIAVAGLGLGAANLARLRWPRRAEALPRVETPVPLAIDDDPEDRLAMGDPDLWAYFQKQRAGLLSEVRIVRGGNGIARADPFALRYAIAVAAALGLLAAGLERGTTRVAQAFAPVGEAGEASVVMLARAGDAAARGWDVTQARVAAWTSPQPRRLEPAQARLQRTSAQVTPK